MKATFDKDGNLLRCEAGQIWFTETHYVEEKGSKTRSLPMGKLQDCVAEYEHRTGQRGTLAKIEAERAKWMDSPERAKLLATEATVNDQEQAVVEATGEPVSAEPSDTTTDTVEAKVEKPKPPKKPTSKAKKA